jgi:hypothetical protein
MRIRRTTCLLAALLGAACTDPVGLPAALDGTWSHFDPAMRYTMTLATQANAVSGSGEWSGEACCTGSISVHGNVAGHTTVAFDLDFVATAGGLQPPPPFSQHFEGRLVRGDSLAGTLTANGQSVPFGYHRGPS